MRVFGLRETIDPSRESIGTWKGFSLHKAVLRRHFLPNMHFQCCMLLQGTLRGNFDIFAACRESTAWVLLWKTRSRPIGVRVCPVVQLNFFSTAIDPRVWTMVVLWKEDSGRQPQLMIPENEGGGETNCPSLGPCGPPVPPGPPGPPGPHGFWPGWPPAPSPSGDRERVRTENTSRERLQSAISTNRSLNLFQFQWVMVMMTPHHRMKERQRSRSRERAHPHVPSQCQSEATTCCTSFWCSADTASGYPRHGWRFSNRGTTESREWPFKVSAEKRKSAERGFTNTHRDRKTTAEMRQPSELPNAEKRKSMDSDEDNEEAQNEPGSSSNSQPIVSVRPLHQGPQEPAASSQGPAAFDNSADEGQWVQRWKECTKSGLRKNSVLPRSQRSDWWWALNSDPKRHTSMQPQPDHFALWLRKMENNGMSATWSQCRVYKGHCASMKWPTTPAAQRLKFQMELTVKQETCWNAVWPLAEKQQEQEPRWDLVHEKKHEVRKFEVAEAKHLEYKSRVDNEVFDLIDMRKVKPKKDVTGRWVFTIKTDKQGNFLKAKARWVLRDFQDTQKEYQQTDSFASTRPGFRMSCQMAASKSWDLFHIDLKTAFLQEQSYDVNRDVVWVNCHQKQVIFHTLLPDWRNLHMACMMLPDAVDHLWQGWRATSFRHFCHLSWFAVRDCHSPFRATSKTFVAHSFSCLFGSRLTSEFATVRCHV